MKLPLGATKEDFERCKMIISKLVNDKTDLDETTFAGHKDNFVSEEWAEKLYEKFQVPVVVSAGIHYDNIDSTGIENVISEMKKALDEVLKKWD